LLGDAAFTAAWEVGRAMSIDQALQGATQDGKQGREETRQRGQGGLTSREYEVANFVTRGLTNEEIARTLVLSERTVEMHVSNAMHKLGLTKRTQLAAWAVEHGLAAGSNRS
jgi:non-specific serine/threonine protein kinase